MTTRTAERIEFLSDLVTTFIESGFSWFTVDVYQWVGVPEACATITDDEDDRSYCVTVDTIARGIGVIRDAVMHVDPKYPQDGEVLHNAKTWQRLYVSPGMRKRILEADRDYDEAVNLDSVDASAIVECALFGAVVYA